MSWGRKNQKTPDWIKTLKNWRLKKSIMKLMKVWPQSFAEDFSDLLSDFLKLKRARDIAFGPELIGKIFQLFR